MFSSTSQKQQPQKRRPNPVKDTAVTILTSGCHFNGKLYCRGASRIGGRIEGQVVSEGLLIIEEDAMITAEVKADEAIIQGTVSGKLEARGRVELCATAKFDGDIVTPVLVVKEGAAFNGRSTMTVTDVSNERKPHIVDAASNTVKDYSPDATPVNEEVAMLKAPEVKV